MKEGKVVEAGGKTEMFTPPAPTAYTDLLLSSVPEMDPDWLDNLLEERGPRERGRGGLEADLTSMRPGLPVAPLQPSMTPAAASSDRRRGRHGCGGRHGGGAAAFRLHAAPPPRSRT